MRRLAGAALARFVRQLARSRTLLGFDYDGTLATFAVELGNAKLRPQTRRSLIRLAKLYPVVIISGRSRPDLRTLVGPLPGVELLGNHGMEAKERPAELSRWVASVAAWKKELAPSLTRLPGVVLEDKRLSLCIHYRGVRDALAVGRAVRAVARNLQGARRIRGKLLLNLVPAGAPDKGQALLAAMRRSRCNRTLFVGDDITDEDAFALGAEHPVAGVRVGRWQRSRACWFLDDQRLVDDLILALIAAKTRG